jgi:hypothetical protein
MKLKCPCLILICIILSGSGALGATLMVSGGTGLQTTINSANPNDVVEITDSQTYHEDVFINKSLTLRGATGQRPVIVATNTSIRGRLGTLGQFIQTGLGAGFDADDQGLYIEADQVTLSNLTIQNTTLANSALHAVDLPAALSIVGDNVTVDNCEISASTNGVVDDTAVFIGEGNLTTFLNSPFAGQQPQTTDNLKIQNSQITNGRRGIYVPDLGAGLSDVNATATGNSQVRLKAKDALVSDTSISVQRRAFQPIGCEDWTFQNCTLNVRATDNQDVIRAQGGSAKFMDCTIGSESNRSINCQANIPVGGGLMDFSFERCIICGGGFGAEHNLIDDANLSFSYCIINSATSPSETPITFLRRVSILQISNDFIGPAPYKDEASFPGRETLPSSFTFSMDHCDLYNGALTAPFRTAIAYNELAPEFTNAPPYNGQIYFSNHLILTNNIITSDIAVLDGTQPLPSQVAFGTEPPFYTSTSSVVALNNIFFSKNGSTEARVRLVSGNGYSATGLVLPEFVANQYIGPVDPADYTPNYLDRDPQYPVWGDCSNAESWLPGDTTLRTAGTDGTTVGSQLEPATSVMNWNLY